MSSLREKLDSLLLSICKTMSEIPLFVSTRKKWVLLGFLMLTILAGLGIPKIKMDQSMDAFFEHDADVLVNYKIFKKVFGSDEAMVVMFEATDGSDIFSPKALKSLKAFEDELNEKRIEENSPLGRITRVRSIISADVLEMKNNSLVSKAFIGSDLPSTKEESELIKQKALKNRDLKGTYFSEDAKFGMIVIKTNYGTREVSEDTAGLGRVDTNKAETTLEDEFDFGSEGEEVKLFTQLDVPNFEKQDMTQYHPFVAGIEELLLKHGWTMSNQLTSAKVESAENKGMHTTLNGNPWVMEFFMSLVMNDMGKFIFLCFIIILFSLYFSFGSLSSLLWPGVIIVLSIACTLGIIGHIGWEVTMMINIVSFLIVTVGVASAIHVLSAFYHFRREGMDVVEGLQKAYYKAGLPILFANLTTVGGMLSLSFVPIPPIASFGWFASIGVLLTFVFNIMLLPCLLMIWSSKMKVDENGDENSLRGRFYTGLRKKLEAMAVFGATRRKLVMSIYAALTVFVLMGVSKITISTNFIEMVHEGYGMVESYNIIDEHFGGTSNIELIIDTGKQNGLHEPKVLQAIERIESQVLTERPDFIKRVDSIIKIAKDSHQKFSDGLESSYKIPNDRNVLAQVLSMFESADGESRRFVVDDNWQMARVTLAGVSKGTNEYTEFTDWLKKLVNKEVDGLRTDFPDVNLTITGNIPMAMELIKFVSTSQFQSFFIALLVICILLIFIYGNIKFGLLAMIPNMFPILCILGAAGWLGVSFDSDTLLVIPVAIGIVVDDTIHFLTHYRTRLLEGADRTQAIKDAATDVGQAMFTTSFILTVGFIVFLFSIYKPFNNFGFLAAIGISMAFIADMLLLPALLKSFNVFKNAD